MDTQSTGTTEEQSSAATDETATSDTSQETGEDADQKREADKKAYLAKLDREIKEAEAKRNSLKKSEPEDADDMMTWMTLNTDELKLVGKEFQEELGFYKKHKIPVTNDIRDRALREAKNRKGIGSQSNADANRQASTSSATQGESRRSTNTREVPESILRLSPKMTPEKYAKHKAEIDAMTKKS